MKRNFQQSHLFMKELNFMVFNVEHCRIFSLLSVETNNENLLLHAQALLY